MSTLADKTSLSLAGEHLVAAQLCLKGHIASMTLKNFPGIEILAYDTSRGKTVNLSQVDQKDYRVLSARVDVRYLGQGTR
jgi:hypothetical protein